MGTAIAQRKAADFSDIYDEADEQQRLTVLFEARYTAMLKAVHEVVRSAFPEIEGYRLDDVTTRMILREAAKRVVRIDETTRDAVRALLQVGQERGYSNWELANGNATDGFPGIQGLFKETWNGRAETIARTELQHAQLVSAVDRYAATGLVDQVQLIDGDDDLPCQSRNGRKVALNSKPRLAHPNCTLVVVPVLKEGV